MIEYEIDSSIGHYLIIEPIEKNSVLKSEEISTVFKVISYRTFGEDMIDIADGDLIIVPKDAVESVMVGTKYIYFVRETDVVAKVSIKK